MVVLLLVKVTISNILENKQNWVYWAIILMGSICIVIVSAFSSTLVIFIYYIAASLLSLKELPYRQ